LDLIRSKLNQLLKQVPSPKPTSDYDIGLPPEEVSDDSEELVGVAESSDSGWGGSEEVLQEAIDAWE
jgi:hypothetical protein